MYIGDTTIIAGINGPLEAKSQKMAYDKISIEVTYTPLKGPASKFMKKLKFLLLISTLKLCHYLWIISEVNDRLIETYIKQTCESAILVSFHPNTMVCINLQELQDSGGVCDSVL